VSHLHKKNRDLLIFLILQLITLPLVISIFKFLEPRILAALAAGSWFCVSSSFMVYRSYKWPKFWSAPVFIVSIIFCIGISFPMLLVRAFHWTQPFDEISIWGLPGPVFHRLSNSVFLALIVATVLEIVRNRKSLYQKN
jgi:hypothetical protein